jgi:drug/metabolite transporter (DMT)-like permease
VAVLLGCLAGVCFGAVNVAVRVGLRRHPDAEIGGFVTAVIALLLVVTVAALTVRGITLREVWPFLVAGTVVPGASQILWIQAIKAAGASRAAILMGTSPLLAALLALAVLGEPFRTPLALGTLLIVAGGVAVAWERRRPADFRVAGVGLALGVAVCLAARDNVARLVLTDRHVPALAAAAALVTGACAFLLVHVLVVRRRDIGLRVLGRAVVPFLPAGLLMGLVYITLLSALDHGRVTVVAPLNGTNAIWTVVFSALVIRRLEMVGPRLVLAAALVVAGGALIGATR